MPGRSRRLRYCLAQRCDARVSLRNRAVVRSRPEPARATRTLQPSIASARLPRAAGFAGLPHLCRVACPLDPPMWWKSGRWKAVFVVVVLRGVHLDRQSVTSSLEQVLRPVPGARARYMGSAALNNLCLLASGCKHYGSPTLRGLRAGKPFCTGGRSWALRDLASFHLALAP